MGWCPAGTKKVKWLTKWWSWSGEKRKHRSCVNRWKLNLFPFIFCCIGPQIFNFYIFLLIGCIETLCFILTSCHYYKGLLKYRHIHICRRTAYKNSRSMSSIGLWCKLDIYRRFWFYAAVFSPSHVNNTNISALILCHLSNPVIRCFNMHTCDSSLSLSLFIHFRMTPGVPPSPLASHLLT